MRKPYEFYKQMHPDQFSDSKIIRASKLDRTFFDYYLNTLTSRGEEKKFEVFCRRIAEKEICPNLLPQTGPTGGGDSKVDSETYLFQINYLYYGIMVLGLKLFKKDGRLLLVQNKIGSQNYILMWKK